MDNLSHSWLTEGHIDFEYKKYVLLAYLQQVSRQFDEKKLYPKLSELVTHYEQLQLFKHKKQLTVESFPRQISKLDFEKLKVQYQCMFDDGDLLKEIDNIVEFALPQIQNKLCLGKELYEEVEQRVEIFPVGILPLRKEEGYFFLSDFPRKAVNVYSYVVTLFESITENYRGIHTRFLFEYRTSASKNYEQVKYELIETNKNLPNPATYAVVFKNSFPLPETMLPVAKRSLIRHISTA
ncbi:MAG: hypothetical protein JNK66_07735 [Chitinophagales bacterium]|nr:hypothetical protein [Chitinophagales bacterium]